MGRILQLIDTTGPGGAETVFVELADKLRCHGHETLAMVRGEGWVLDTLVERQVDHLVVDAKGSFRVDFLAELVKVIRRRRIDLVHAHLLGSCVYAGLAASIARVPVIGTFHGMVDVSERESYRWIKAMVLNGCLDRRVLVSDSLQSMMAGDAGLLSAPTTVVHNGIDVGRYANCTRSLGLRERLALPAEVALVGALGNVRPAKAYDTLLDAFRSVLDRGLRAHLVIAGQGHDRLMTALLEQRRRLGLEEHTTFLGFESDTPAYLRDLDLYVLSSSSEGFSLTTLEAMASGVPVVATRSGGPQEILEHGVSGLLVPPEAPEELAEAIVEVLGSPDMAERLKAGGWRRVESSFSLDAMIHAYSGLYEELGVTRSATRPETSPESGL